MAFLRHKLMFFAIISCTSYSRLVAQQLVSFRLPDTGQTTSYSATEGEDADFIVNPPSFTDNGDGTVTDNITG